MLEKVALAAAIGVFVGVGFLYVRRISIGATARFWAWAWLAFFASLAASAVPHPLMGVFSHATGSVFPVLLLAGACSFVGRSLPGFWVPLGLCVGLVRGVANWLGIPLVSEMGVYLFEAPVDLAAGWIVLHHAKTVRESPAVAVVGAMLIAFGFLEVTNTIFLAGGASPSVVYFAVGMLATLALALAQILALAEQVRAEHVADLELLRGIAHAGTLERESGGVIGHALAGLRNRLAVDAGGVWLLRDDDRFLACVEFFAHVGVAMPDDLAYAPADRPLPKHVLATGEPIWIDDLKQLPDLPVHPIYADIGLRSGVILPLRRGDDSLGILVLGRARVQPFDESERRILQTAASELSLAVQRVEAVSRLAGERRVLASVLAASPTGIAVAGPLGTVDLTNGTFALHLGLEPSESFVGRPIAREVARVADRLGHEGELVRAFDVAVDAPPLTVSATVRGRDERELLVFSAPIEMEDAEGVAGRVWVTRDVSEERRLQAQLRQSQKMETLGTLAGGVAHDFNNQLTAILGNTRWALARQPDDAQLQAALGDAVQAAEHCADLTRSLLAFARRAPLATAVVAAESIFDQAEGLLRSLIPSTIDLRLEKAAALPAIAADATQLQQALINLVVNARDALGGEGRIVLSVGCRDITRPPRDEAAAGRYVEFRVSDDGPGMNEATQQRIFDPFYTTKGLHEGTGLGLALVYGAARSHGGWVEVESAPGHGSTFRLLIPSTAEKAVAQRVGTAPASGSGRETILVADDEEKLRRLVVRILERAGYEILEAGDGRETLEIFENAPGEIDLAVLDVTMPFVDGVEALRQMRRSTPGLPALLVSGLLEVDAPELSEPRTAYLPKPYDLAELESTVRRLLDEGV